MITTRRGITFLELYNSLAPYEVDFSYMIEASDRPGNNDGIVLSLKMDSGYGSQIYFENSSNIYLKTLARGSWGEWKKVIFV